jgi:hypothetical protein
MDRAKLRARTLIAGQTFDFSQASLQDYVDCQRRFQLRYLQQLHWPAAQSEPIRENEAAIRRGERFHRLAQQALLDIPRDKLERSAQADPDPALAVWWQSFASLLPALPAGARKVESLLAAPLGKHRLVAKYDLLILSPERDRLWIYDWKTSPRKPKRASLEARLQSRVYPYLLARTAAALNQGQPVQPERIEMIYWFAAQPEIPERFVYSPEKFQRDQRDLLALVEEIASLKEEEFLRTEDEKPCRFCVYRSLCARGVQAGAFAESEEEIEPSEEISIDFDQIGEIGF